MSLNENSITTEFLDSPKHLIEDTQVSFRM